MIILGIETSCDETAAAVLEQKNRRIQILSNVVASSASIQSKYGGIIPEQAAREQLKSIIPVINEALAQAFNNPTSHLNSPSSHLSLLASKIDAIAVTQGPGLIGSLLVGVETAKTLATVWNKPLIPVNHLIGHFYANWIEVVQPTFPCIGLLVSGGHTDLVLFTDHGKYKYLGGTRDDAAGECFDKCARLLGLPYPGGPVIAQRAMEFKIKNLKFKIELPRPLIFEKNFDFSFSGLKSATSREVDRLKKIKQFNNQTIQQLSYEVEAAIIEVLVTKTVRAAQKYKVEQIIVAGGVAASQKLKSELIKNCQLPAPNSIEGSIAHYQLHIPPPKLCTDNGAMIAAAAFFPPHKEKSPFKLQADPNLSLAY